MAAQTTKIISLLCIFDQKLRLLFQRTPDLVGANLEFINVTLEKLEPPLPILLRHLQLEYKVSLAAKQCRAWFFQAYDQDNSHRLALLYYALAEEQQVPQSNQLVWSKITEITDSQVTKPTSLFLPYLLQVVPSIHKPEK